MQLRHGSLESAILSALWNLEKNGVYTNSVRNVYDYLIKNEDDKRAYTTIKTVMDRLFEKKIILKYKENKKFYYKTLYTKNQIIFKALDDIAKKYCDGNIIKLAEYIQKAKA